jgi:hypothetical protein
MVFILCGLIANLAAACLEQFEKRIARLEKQFTKLPGSHETHLCRPHLLLAQRDRTGTGRRHPLQSLKLIGAARGRPKKATAIAIEKVL